MTTIKFCGIQNMETVEAINQLPFDVLKYIGFVLAPSRRQVTGIQLKALINALSPKQTPVGVFVNPTTKELESALLSGIQVLQFHGDESHQVIEAHLETLFGNTRPSGLQIWKVLRVDKTFLNSELSASQKGREASKSRIPQPNLSPFNFDKVLLDKLDPLAYGGTGKTFDWQLLKDLPIPPSQVIIAGGIHAGNVQNLMAQYEPSIIDVSSGIETEGQKDVQKMIAFLKAFEESSGIQSQTML